MQFIYRVYGIRHLTKCLCLHQFAIMFKDKVQFNWEFFSDHVLKSYTSTFNDPTLADVTLVSDDNISISAHKFILSSASPVLRKFFTSSPGSAHQCLFMFGLSNNILRSILEFIYTGETMVKSEELDAFLRGAKNLDLSGVKTRDNQPAPTFMNNLNNSFQAAQQELNILLPRSSTPLDPRRSSNQENKRVSVNHEQKGNTAMRSESSPICIEDFPSMNEDGELVEGYKLLDTSQSQQGEEGEVLNTSQIQQPHYKVLATIKTQQPHPVSIPSRGKGVKGQQARKEPFSCVICDRVFQYRSNLKSHVALKHANATA